MTLPHFRTTLAEIRAMTLEGGDTTQAEERARELLEAIRAMEHSTPAHRSELGVIQCDVLLQLSMFCRDREAYDDAFQYAFSCIAIATENDLQRSAANAYREAGTARARQHRQEEALELFQTSFSLYQTLADKNGMATAAREMGAMHTNLGDYMKALEYSELSLSLHEELGNTKMQAIVTADIGIAYYSLSDLDRAIAYMSKAVESFRELGEEVSEARHTGNIGNVYWSLGNYESALEYMRRALSKNETLGYKRGIAFNTGNIGRVYAAMSDTDNAIIYTKQALALFEELNDHRSLAFFMTALGVLYAEIEQYDEAYEQYRRSLDLSNQVGDKGQIATNNAQLGILYASEGFRRYDAAEAETTLRIALAQAEEHRDKGLQYRVHRFLSDLLQQEGRWEEALHHYSLYHELEKMVQSEEATKNAQQLENRRKIEDAERDRQLNLARFQEQEKILHNILPSHIADRMIDGETIIADAHENVSVFFSDIVNFTKLSQRITAGELVQLLNGIFSEFDRMARKHGLEKIKTIGDAYMAVAGAPIAQDDHAERATRFALDVVEAMNNYRMRTGTDVQIRIGLHTGSVVAGIIGENKFAYDLWGDAVNTASRMEQRGEAGAIHVSQDFVDQLLRRDGLGTEGIRCVERGELEIKGKGLMRTYFLEKA